MEAAVGVAVHQVIAELAGRGSTPGIGEVIDAVAQRWKLNPVGGSVAGSARSAAATSAAVYFQRFVPAGGWSLDGVEVRLGSAVADLVWVDGEDRVVIDEVKSGSVSVASQRVADQLRRLAAGGAKRWGDGFVGVRLVPLASPARSVIVAGERLERVAVPAGMEVRS